MNSLPSSFPIHFSSACDRCGSPSVHTDECLCDRCLIGQLEPLLLRTTASTQLSPEYKQKLIQEYSARIAKIKARLV